MLIWLTGCTQGLGLALTEVFSKRGHTIVGCGRNEIALQRLSEQFPNSSFIPCDVSDDGSVQIPYADIPGFPTSTAPTHKGLLHLGRLQNRPVVAMQGRVHMYEGYQPAEVVYPMRVMAGLGATTALLTNAAGGLDSTYKIGDLVIVEDHLSLANLAGADPLRGPNDLSLGPRFVSMNGAYDRELINLALRAGQSVNEALNRGTYAFVTGPTFESPAEVRFLQSLGCQLVGMSTVPEVVAARHLGMQVLAISSVTNMSVTSVDDDHITNEAEVWENVEAIRPRLQAVVNAILQNI